MYCILIYESSYLWGDPESIAERYECKDMTAPDIHLSVTVSGEKPYQLSGKCEYHIYSYRYCYLNLETVENSNSCCKFQFFPNELRFCCRNYSSEETIWGNMVLNIHTNISWNYSCMEIQILYFHV